jgi:hypothetical protein
MRSKCGLKSLILRWTSKSDFSAVLSDWIEVGKKGHDFEYLKGLLKKRMGKRGSTDRESFGKLSSSFQIMTSWSHLLRYESGSRDPAVAREMIKAAQDVYEWCERG